MGNNTTKIHKCEIEIKNDIQVLNNLTRSQLFEKRVGLNIEFYYSKNKRKVITTLVNII